MKTAMVVGAGEIDEPALLQMVSEKHMQENGMVIAVDGGYDTLCRLQIAPTIQIGDWDSSKSEKVTTLKNTIVLPTHKDDTDMLAALRLAVERGAKKMYIFGGLGGDRVEHSFANIQCLIYLHKHNVTGYLCHKQQIITILEQETMQFPAEMKGFFSAFAVSEKVEDVTLKGFAYEVENDCFTNDYPIGVSNEFLEKNASLTVGKGMLVVVYPQKNAENIIRSKFLS